MPGGNTGALQSNGGIPIPLPDGGVLEGDFFNQPFSTDEGNLVLKGDAEFENFNVSAGQMPPGWVSSSGGRTAGEVISINDQGNEGSGSESDQSQDGGQSAEEETQPVDVVVEVVEVPPPPPGLPVGVILPPPPGGWGDGGPPQEPGGAS